MSDTIVTVRLIRDTDTNEVKLEVSIRSNTRTGLNTHVSIPADESPDTLEYKISAAAEKIAVAQNLAYGDTHDPADVAKQARAAMRDILRRADRANRSIGVSAIDETVE